MNELNTQLSELNRSGPQQAVVAGTQPLVATLSRIGKDQADRLEAVVGRMLECGRSIPLTAPLFTAARQLEGQFDLSPQDAIVAASVLGDLQPQNAPPDSHCFLSRNSNDFNPMRADFLAVGRRYIPRFEHGLQFIRTKI